MFEAATRNKYRFPFRGQISVEDLWDLTPDQLNTVFKTLSAEAKTMEEESLVRHRTGEEVVLENKITIVRYIFDKKHEEAEARKQKAANAEKRRRLMDLIASKEEAALGEKSIEDLKKMLESIE